MRNRMEEITVMDVLLGILAVLFASIGLAMRRLRNRMEADMKKNIVPYMGMRHMVKHRPNENQKRGRKK